MIWPEHCFICWPRVNNPPQKPVIYNPQTGNAFCRKCEALPGFYKTFWEAVEVTSRLIRAVEDERSEDAK